MTENKLICPFCKEELSSYGDYYGCGNVRCAKTEFMFATRDVWEYIDRTRKALDIAVDALKLVYQGNGDPQDIMRYKDNRWTAVRRLCRQALEQITPLKQ